MKITSFFYRAKLLICVLIISTILLPASAFADILGHKVSTSQTELAQGTTLYTNTYVDSTVGRQTEHFVTYSPSADVMPVLTNGYSVYGKRTLTSANDILDKLGYNTAMGVNADFFSFQTGVPMSNTIIDGKVLTKDASWLWGIGFRKDGTAFTAKFPITTTIATEDGYCFTVECINKYRQPYALYLFTDDYGDETYSPGWGRDVILGSVSGDITLGSSITAVVESKEDNDGSVSIPDNKMVLSVSADATEDIKARLLSLEPGTKVTITTQAAESADHWNDALWAVGCTGGKLLTDGKPDLEDEAAAPRTAIGIKPDGTVIFYTIDGRQSGYSYGARKETVAKRLLELGCTEAVNLDGGGSTSIGATLPGTTDFKVINSPSEGGLRSCANFFFLLKLVEPTGVPYKLVLDNYGTKLLSGASVDIKATYAYDTSYGPAQMPDNIEYYIENDADTPEGTGSNTYVTPSGHLTVHGNGDVYVSAKGGAAEGTTMVTSITTPDEIRIYNADAGYYINELVMEPGSTVNLAAESYWYGDKLISDNSCYRWTIVSDDASVGKIDSNGVFHASSVSDATGILAVSAGTCAVEIPIIIREGGDFPEEGEPPIIDAEIYLGKLRGYVIARNLTKDDITVTADGKRIDFDYNSKIGKISCNLDDKYSRVGIFVTDENGLSAMKFFDNGNINALSNHFPDTKGHWASSYISYLASLNVVNGSLEDGGAILFKPGSNMTRTEFAIMLCNYLGIDANDYTDVKLPFTDNGDIPWWAENNIKAIYSLGIMKGQLNEYGVAFNPSANINRMEFAISLGRLLPEGLSSEPVDAVDADEIPFWAQESMRVIVTQGIMSGYPDGTLLPAQSVTRAEAVKMLFNIFGAGK